MYNLDDIILQHSNTQSYKLLENIYFLQVIFNRFNVRVGQNLIFVQKQFVRKGLTGKCNNRI